MQMVSGNASNVQPPTLAGNKYLGPASTCLTNSWGSDTFNCPEFINYYSGLFNLTVSQAMSLYDVASKANLDDEVVASLITLYIMNTSEDKGQAVLKGIYGIDDFYAAFEMLRTMIESYLFGGAQMQTS
jgi:hypothetical protein